MSSKDTKDMLQVTPKDEIEWNVTLGRNVSNSLQLSNPTNKFVAFKVKTTAPKQYCVRPNSGVVEPNNSVEVIVLLQPLKEYPEGRCKDKFLVQSVNVEDTEMPTKDRMTEIWNTIEKEKKLPKEEQTLVLHDQKLKCKYSTPPKPRTVPEENERGSESDRSRTPRTEAAAGGASSGGGAQESDAGRARLAQAEAELVAMKRDKKTLQEEAAVLHSKLENMKKELERVQGDKASGVTYRAPKGAASDKGSDVASKTATKTAPSSNVFANILSLILVALVFFVLGRMVNVPVT